MGILMKVKTLLIGRASCVVDCMNEFDKRDIDVSYKIVDTQGEFDLEFDAAQFDLLILDYTSAFAKKIDLKAITDECGVYLPVLAFAPEESFDSAVEMLENGVTSVLRTRSCDELCLSILQLCGNHKRLQNRLSKMSVLLDRVPEAIIICDKYGRISYWNKGAENMYGFEKEQAHGSNAESLLPQSDRENFRTVRKTVWKNGEWIGKLQQVDADNKEFTIICRCYSMMAPEGQVEAILFVNSKVVDSKEVQEQYLRSQRLESIGTLAGGLAHDLNNVFTPILMTGFLMRTKTEDESIIKLINNVEQSAQRGADVVKQIMTIAQGADGEHNSIQIKHILRDVVNVSKETFPKVITFSANVIRGMPVIEGDATQLKQVFLNICLNARDAIGKNGGSIQMDTEVITLDESFVTIYTDCVRTGEYVRVGVTDDGCGISNENMERIFDPFFTTGGIGKRTGLGLSTASSIVRGHGGFIAIDSKLGKGTRVDVYLPIPVIDKKNLEDTTEERFVGNGECILVIDDEASFRDLAELTLKEFGYDVITATNGADGIAKFAIDAEKIAVVLTDVVMPIMDGVATIVALKNICPKVRIIATSGYLDDDRIEEAKRTADKFLRRPFAPMKLLKIIRELIVIKR